MPNYYNNYPQSYMPLQTYAPMQPYSAYSYPNLLNNNSNGIIWVQGESGAKSYPVAPNNTMILFDSESQTFFVKKVDSSGMPMPLRTFDYTERATVAPQNDFTETDDKTLGYVTKSDLEQFKTEITDMLAKKTPKKKEVITDE